MERPSNLIIAFVGAIASAFVIFALGRIAVFVLPPTETGVESQDSFLVEE